jgi:nucleolar protein 15
MPEIKSGLDSNTDNYVVATEDAGSIAAKKSKAPKPATTNTPKAKVLKNTTLVPDAITTQNSVDISTKIVKLSKGSAIHKTKASTIRSSPNIENKKLKQPKVAEVELTEKPTHHKVEEAEVFTSDDEDIDDQTEALLQGFESDEGEDHPKDQGYQAGQDIPKTDPKLKKRTKGAQKAPVSDTPGVLYVGRIPHGFYEHQMRQYFSQFGDILRIRLSRNRKTGRSKHFAFLEFKSTEVADIVAKTMDNYLLFGHILKCKIVPLEQVHEGLFKGANKRFKKVPWNKLEGRKLAQGMTRDEWDKRVEKEEQRRTKKGKTLEKMGYSLETPKLKPARDIPRKENEPLAVEANVEADDVRAEAIESHKDARGQVSTISQQPEKKAENSIDEINFDDKAMEILPSTNKKVNKVAKHQKPAKLTNVEEPTNGENVGKVETVVKVTKPAKSNYVKEEKPMKAEKPSKAKKPVEAEKVEKARKPKNGKQQNFV